MKRTRDKKPQKQNKKTDTQIPLKKTEEKSFIKKYLKYLFLILIVFFIGTNLYKEIYKEVVFSDIQNILQFPTILIGIFALYFDRQKLSEIINGLFSSEKENLSFLKKTKAFFSKKEILTSSLFILVLGISVFTLFNKLNNFAIFSDEIQVTKGAAGYYYTDKYKQWDFIKEKTVGKPYTVAKPHQWMVAKSYELFGVNTFAARFPSAFFGVLLIAFMYLLGNCFIKDKYAALMSALAFALYFEFLFLGRWTRMYGMIYPMFFLIFYWTFKLINENNRLGFIKLSEHPFLNKYFNFNYIYIPFILTLLYIGINTHTNITVVFLIYLIYVFIGVFLFGNKKKYLSLAIFAALILILQILFPYKVNFQNFTFFKADNSPIYNKAFFACPFSVKTGVILLYISFSTLFFIKNKDFQKKYLLLFITVVIPWVFFSYIIKFAANYRYVSFLTPFAVLLITGSFMLINRALYGRTLQIILSILFLASVGLSFSNNYKNLYVKNIYSPAKPSIAQQAIINNIKEGDVIFKHWGPKMYLKGIPQSTKFYSLGTYQGEDIKILLEKMSEHPTGWVTWYKHHENRLDQNFVNYCNLYLKKYTGYGIDKTGEEIYYYNQKMLKSLKKFSYQQNLPTANLSLKNTYSIVFDLKVNNDTEGSVFYIKNDSINDANCMIDNDRMILSSSGNDSISVPLPEDQLNKIIWTFSPDSSIIYVNGKKTAKKNLRLNPDLVKFQVNPQFNGYMNNIRVYNFILNKDQITAIADDNNISEKLTVNGKTFRALFVWKKK